jgi:hypothetical protein
LPPQRRDAASRGGALPAALARLLDYRAVMMILQV